MAVRLTVILGVTVLLVGCGDSAKDDRGVCPTATAEAGTTAGSAVPGAEWVWAQVPYDEAAFRGVGDSWIRLVEMSSVVAGGPGLVAVGYDHTGDGVGVVWVSADGYTWTRIDDEAVFGGFDLAAVTTGGPGLVAVGWRNSAFDEDAAVWVSVDGYAWSREAVLSDPGHQRIRSLTAGGPGLVAVGYDYSTEGSDGVVWVSADGYTWTRIDDEAVFGGPGSLSIWSVTAGGPGLVAVGSDYSDDQFDGAVWVSADGYTWSRIDDAAFGGHEDQEIYSITAGGPGLVAVGSSGRSGDGAVWVSADGYTWSRVDDEAVFGGSGQQEIRSVVAGGPGLVAIGKDYSGGDLDAVAWVSADGCTWARVGDEALGGAWDQWIDSIAVRGPGLVAVGKEGRGGGDMDAAVWLAAPSSA